MAAPPAAVTDAAPIPAEWVARDRERKIPLGELIKPKIIAPWVIVSLVALALITYLPEITMVVPKLLFR